MKTIDLNDFPWLDGFPYKDITYMVDNIDFVGVLENLCTIFNEGRYNDTKLDSCILAEKQYYIEYLGTKYVVKRFDNISKDATFGPLMCFFVPDKLMHEYKQSKQTFLIQI